MPTSNVLARQESLSKETNQHAMVADTRGVAFLEQSPHDSTGFASQTERPGGAGLFSATAIQEGTQPKLATALGEHFYLFQREPGKTGQKLIISSHGEYLPGMHIRVPENTKLVYYGPDGKTLQDPGLGNVANGFVQTYEEKGPHSRVRNYLLSKYEQDSYETIERQVRPGVDILSVRNRKKPRLLLKNSLLSLNDVLIELAKNGIQYSEIHCVLCRCPTLNPFAGNFIAPEVPPIEWPKPNEASSICLVRPAQLDADLLDPLSGCEFLTVQHKANVSQSSPVPQELAAKNAEARKAWFESS